MIIFEVKQQKELKDFLNDDGDHGIYFQFAEMNNGKNIKPFFGLWESFTKEGRFTVERGATVTYKGLKRIAINALAAATFAKYDWNMT